METPFFARKLTGGDVPATVALEEKCFPSAWSAEQYKAALLEQWFRLYGIFSRENSMMAGYLALSLAAGEAEVLNIAVLPEFRGRGLGTLLLRFAFGDMQGMWERAFLEVRPSNAPARALYSKTGFRVSGRRRQYYADGEDALIMTLEASAFMLSEVTP